MISVPLVFVLLLVSGLIRPAGAAPLVEAEPEVRLLETFRAAFAPDASERPPTTGPCLTLPVAEYRRHRDRLAPETVAEIDAWLTPSRGVPWYSHLSSSGLFELHYTTEGFEAVAPDDDDPANGIPDLVERCGVWAETTWQTEFVDLGFLAPALPADGSYDLTFKWLGTGGVLGVTIEMATEPGVTEIWLHRSFRGSALIPTADPDGNQSGRAKHTIAHELKHASQFAATQWSGGGWVELDAMWPMDIVFDESNSHWFFTDNPGSPFANPETPLDDGGAGYYEDFAWETYLQEWLGVSVLLDLWDLRAVDPAQPFLESYAAAMALHGTDWADAWAGFLEWNWLVGSRAVPGVGYEYEEGSSFFDLTLREPAVTGYPYLASDSVEHLAGHARQLQAGGSVGRPVISFDGDDAASGLALSIVLSRTDGTVDIVRPALDAANDVTWTAVEIWPALQHVGLLVSNSSHTEAASYVVTVSVDPVVSAPLTTPERLAITVYPNPFSTSATLAFGRPLDRAVRIRIVDVAGRAVRRTEVGTGTSRWEWDGLDGAGRRVAAGTYYMVIRSKSSTAVRSLIHLR